MSISRNLSQVLPADSSASSTTAAPSVPALRRPPRYSRGDGDGGAEQILPEGLREKWADTRFSFIKISLYKANAHSVLLDEGRAEDDAAREVGGRAPRGVHDPAPRHGARVRQRVLLS